MKCPKCGFSPKLGRPSKIDSMEAFKLRGLGWTLQNIADFMGVTKSAIAYVLKGKGK